MLSKTKKQFISLYHIDNQVKVGYQVYEKNKLVINQNSAILSSKDKLPKELEMIFVAKQNEIKESYVSTLINCVNEKIIPKSQNFNTENFASIALSDEYNVVVPKLEIVKVAHFFGNAGVDFIFSPLQILHSLFLENPSNDTLNVLLYGDKIIFLMLNKNDSINYGTDYLTKFSEVSQSEYFDDEIGEQKLYNEIYYLEVLSKISIFLDSISSKVSKVSIFYDLKQLSNENLSSLESFFDIEISYKKANILDHLLDFSMSKEKYKSYILPRQKKISNTLTLGILGAIASGIVAFGLVYFINSFLDSPKPKITQSAKPKIITASLPNHVIQNQKIVDELNFIFESIPLNVTLNSVTINSKGSVFECEFITQKTYQAQMQKHLLSYYGNSKVEFKRENGELLGVIANDVKPDFNSTEPNLQVYKYSKKFDAKSALATFENLLPKNGQISLQAQMDDGKFQTFAYNANFVITSPKEFFDFIDALNKSGYSILLSEPTSFVKAENGIEIKTMILFNQAK